MEGITWGGIVALLGVCTSGCSVAAFFIGRRKAATDAAKEDTKMSLDLQYIKDTLRETTKSIDKLVTKMDAQHEAREQQYREMLVEFTKLKSSYTALHNRLDALADEVARYHHN